ncbi:hypothetical protein YASMINEVIRUS_78 [Yasminevirus sp. GU-2018]|uniref:VWFA domain-containing protein n=1 Tax=Yasminevirus sp. GU-2018 TaxID=2420051 RepID=A0A5K0U739_9VIRU|nr:hypothetical protein YASMINEVIRUS_78 [Yasminevirus sp. GU-2018]
MCILDPYTVLLLQLMHGDNDHYHDTHHLQHSHHQHYQHSHQYSTHHSHHAHDTVTSFNPLSQQAHRLSTSSLYGGSRDNLYAQSYTSLPSSSPTSFPLSTHSYNPYTTPPYIRPPPFNPECMPDQEYYESAHDSVLQPVHSSNGTQKDPVNESAKTYGVSACFMTDLPLIDTHEVFLVCDDSGSVGMDDLVTHEKKNSSEVISRTTWETMRETTKIVVGLCASVNPVGITIVMVNGQHYTNVYHPSQCDPIFDKTPVGFGSRAEKLKWLFSIGTIKPKLVLFMTNGWLTTNKGDETTELVTTLKKHISQDTKLSVMLIPGMRENKKTIQNYKRLDNSIDYVDLIRDYQYELKKVKAVNTPKNDNGVYNGYGYSFSYSFGDHVARFILAPLVQEYRLMNEKRLIVINDKTVKSGTRRDKTNDSCVIV